MSTHSLNSGAEAIVQVMDLNAEAAETVRSCILKYTLPDAFCERLSWVVYRIKQAIKSIFGNSNWQTTHSIMQSQFIQKALDRGIIQHHPENPTENNFKEVTVRQFSLLAQKLLSFALVAQQEKTEDVPELRNKLTRLRLDYQLLELQKQRP